MAEKLGSTRVMDALANVGLNSYERKLYLALLSKGVSTAGSLSEQSTVPRSRCYDVLESLREKGFVVLQNSKPIQYLAVEPREALDKMKSVYEERYNEAVERIERMQKSKSIDELEEIFTKGVGGVSSAELSGSIKGRNQSHQHMESAIKRSKKSLSILTSAQGIEELAANHSRHLKAAKGRGVNIRIAGHVDKDNRDHADALSKFAEVRHANKNEGRIMLSDSNEVLMALTSHETHPSEDMHFWTQSDHISATMASPMFENVWKASKTL